MLISLFTVDERPGCKVCTTVEIEYCTGSAAIEDDCNCDRRHLGNIQMPTCFLAALLRFTSRVYIYYKCILCCFHSVLALLFSITAHKMCCFKVNYTMNTKYVQPKNFYFVKYSQQNCLDFNKACIFCHVAVCVKNRLR